MKVLRESKNSPLVSSILRWPDWQRHTFRLLEATPASHAAEGGDEQKVDIAFERRWHGAVLGFISALLYYVWLNATKPMAMYSCCCDTIAILESKYSWSMSSISLVRVLLIAVISRITSHKQDFQNQPLHVGWKNLLDLCFVIEEFIFTQPLPGTGTKSATPKGRSAPRLRFSITCVYHFGRWRACVVL